jgi:hypothetical protein
MAAYPLDISTSPTSSAPSTSSPRAAAEGASRTIDGYEAMHLSGQIRWLPKGDVVGQRRFIHTLSLASLRNSMLNIAGPSLPSLAICNRSLYPDTEDPWASGTIDKVALEVARHPDTAIEIQDLEAAFKAAGLNALSRRDGWSAPYGYSVPGD